MLLLSSFGILSAVDNHAIVETIAAVLYCKLCHVRGSLTLLVRVVATRVRWYQKAWMPTSNNSCCGWPLLSLTILYFGDVHMPQPATSKDNCMRSRPAPSRCHPCCIHSAATLA